MSHPARSTSRPAPHGRVVGRYLMFGQIGSGGTATVHFGRLRGQGGFSRTVALKRLHAHLARDPYFASLFMSEARLGARISHPNVASLLDVVRLDDGEILLVMDYVHGETLAGLLSLCRRREDPIPARIAVAVMIGALRGLHAAHEAMGEDGQPLGLVHGDVSPHNVIVGTDGTSRVLDFGVARADVANSRDRRVIGTLAYMAPERLAGDTFDRRSDVFSAGVLLWEMLSMRRLFASSDGRSKRSMAKIPPPSTLHHGIPRGLDAVVLHALRADPDERPQNAFAMALELEQALPPATPAEVADWLNQAAGARLRERAEELSRIERTSAPALLDDDQDDPGEMPTTSAIRPAPARRSPVGPGAPMAAQPPRQSRQPIEPAPPADDDEPTLYDAQPVFRAEDSRRDADVPVAAAPGITLPLPTVRPRNRRTLTPQLTPLPAAPFPVSPSVPPPPPAHSTDEYAVAKLPRKLEGRWLLLGALGLVMVSAGGAWRLARATAAIGSNEPAAAIAASTATDMARAATQTVAAPQAAGPRAQRAPAALPTALPAASPPASPAPAAPSVAEPAALVVEAPAAGGSDDLTPPDDEVPESFTLEAPEPLALAATARPRLVHQPLVLTASFADQPLEAATSTPEPAASEPPLAAEGAKYRRPLRDRVVTLNARGLDSYERLDPATALRQLSFALRLCQRLGKADSDVTARTHVNLAVVLAGGFKQRGLASRHFRLARALAPTIRPAGMYSNPEIEAALREAAGTSSSSGF